MSVGSTLAALHSAHTISKTIEYRYISSCDAHYRWIHERSIHSICHSGSGLYFFATVPSRSILHLVPHRDDPFSFRIGPLLETTSPFSKHTKLSTGIAINNAGALAWSVGSQQPSRQTSPQLQQCQQQTTRDISTSHATYYQVPSSIISI